MQDWRFIFTARRHSISFPIYNIVMALPVYSKTQLSHVTDWVPINIQTIDHCRYFPTFCISDISQLTQFTSYLHSLAVVIPSWTRHLPDWSLPLQWNDILHDKIIPYEVIPDFLPFLLTSIVGSPSNFLVSMKMQVLEEVWDWSRSSCAWNATVHATFIEFTIQVLQKLCLNRFHLSHLAPIYTDLWVSLDVKLQVWHVTFSEMSQDEAENNFFTKSIKICTYPWLMGMTLIFLVRESCVSSLTSSRVFWLLSDHPWDRAWKWLMKLLKSTSIVWLLLLYTMQNCQQAVICTS